MSGWAVKFFAFQTLHYIYPLNPLTRWYCLYSQALFCISGSARMNLISSFAFRIAVEIILREPTWTGSAEPSVSSTNNKYKEIGGAFHCQLNGIQPLGSLNFVRHDIKWIRLVMNVWQRSHRTLCAIKRFALVSADEVSENVVAVKVCQHRAHIRQILKIAPTKQKSTQTIDDNYALMGTDLRHSVTQNNKRPSTRRFL